MDVTSDSRPTQGGVGAGEGLKEADTQKNSNVGANRDVEVEEGRTDATDFAEEEERGADAEKVVKIAAVIRWAHQQDTRTDGSG